jgi:hypothetical protein
VTPAAAIALVALTELETAATPRPVEQPVTAPVDASPDLVVPVLHGVALMGVMRATETVLWPIPFAYPEHFAWHYEQAYTRPPKFDTSQSFMRWDGDPWPINVIGHGLFGSEIHLRARQCRLGLLGSLAFTTATSAVWEYVFEANGVRPSALDLVYTPLMGMALGEVRYAVHRAARGLGSPAARRIVRALVDPLGEIERAAGAGC